MNEVTLLPPEYLGRNFIPDQYLPEGKDEYHHRNKQVQHPKSGWRKLKPEEIENLTRNNNTADDWNDLLVADPFDTKLIRNNRFFGLVRIGSVRNIVIQHHEMRVPAGITNSMIISSDIGNDAAIHNVHYLAHFIIGEHCVLLNIDEMHTTNHAKFGNGILKDGETEHVRTWLDLMNETGCRRVLPFDGMTTADAYLWAKYRDDEALMERLKTITQEGMDSSRGFYGTTGKNCVIKNSRILKDVKVGPYCYIKGANKLKNLTINSSEEEPSQIGEGVELVNGIIGYGCHIFYGCKAVNFILGNHSNLKYGARLINSFLGDNSTISCCEVLNNLIFPAHEQHHNNSFLVASVVMGQSNIAAGATIGSNHNSRSNDNEVQAGRGFWPGLCTSLKHSSRFASYVLISKSDYPAELDIPLPFSLLNNNLSKDQLEVMPAYWWMYNMYALARNEWKFNQRDQRKLKVHYIEFDTLAPDTAEEIIHGMRLLEIWTAKAYLRQKGESSGKKDDETLSALGKQLLHGEEQTVNGLEILGEHMEHSKRKVIILKPYQAYHAYKDMLYYYAGKSLVAYFSQHLSSDFASAVDELKSIRIKEWVNLGGQLMRREDLDRLRTDIRSGKVGTWEEIHNRYDELWERYTIDKQKHASAILCELYGTTELTKSLMDSFLNKFLEIQEYVNLQVFVSRRKDYDNPFKKTTFRNTEEMTASVGIIDENNFIIQVRRDTEHVKELVSQVRSTVLL